VTEQGYKAVLAVIANGRSLGEVASEWGVCRQTMHRWLGRYEKRWAGGSRQSVVPAGTLPASNASRSRGFSAYSPITTTV
jgi:transposase-like protein